MSIFYDTKYSLLNNLNRKEKKQIQSSFPFTSPNQELEQVDICGQRLETNDLSLTTKFCPICDSPMIVRILISPCDHVICFSCSQPETENCYVCNGKVSSIKRLPDKAKLYECDYPDCFRFCDSYEKLIQHKVMHGVNYIGSMA